MSPSFVIVIVIIVVVVVVIYISIDRVFFYCYHHYLLATDVTISSFCFTSICLHVRTLKYRRVSFFFSFFFQRSNVSFPLFFFSSLLYTFISHPPSHPSLSPKKLRRVAYCTIFNTSHFSFNHVSLSYFSSVRTYFFSLFLRIFFAFFFLLNERFSS